MRILFIDTVSRMGGAQWSLLELAVRFSGQGMEPCAAVPEGPLAEKLRAAGIRVYTLPLFRPRRTAALTVRVRGIVALFVCAWRLLGIVRAAKVDLLYANSLAAATLVSLLPFRKPLVWHVRDLNLAPRMAHRAARRAQRIIAASQAIDEHLCELLPRDTLGRIKLVMNGIDTARFAPADRTAARQALGLPVDAPVIGMLAHMVPWKRHDQFLRVAAQVKARHPSARFVLAGQDLFGEHAAWIARLRAQAQKANLESSLLWIDCAEDTAPVIAALDVLVHPPVDEPFGRVLCEAMAMQVPVVAMDKAGPSGIVADGETGLLALPREPNQLAEKTLDLLADPLLARRMGAAGRKRVLAHFNADRTASQAAAVCREALAAYRSERA